MKSIVCSLFLMCFSALVCAQDTGDVKDSKKEAPQSEAAQALVERLSSIQAMSGKFQQSIVDADGETLQDTEGQFKILRPGYFLWHVAPPYEQKVVGTPESLKVYDPDLEQMTVHAQNSLAGTPAALISGDTTLVTQDYAVTQEMNKKQTRFVLTQRNENDSDFESLSFEFKGKNADKLSGMSFTDKLGQRTQITFKRLDTAAKLTGESFQFEPPAGTDIILDD